VLQTTVLMPSAYGTDEGWSLATGSCEITLQLPSRRRWTWS
jgi:hypothetical protein